MFKKTFLFGIITDQENKFKRHWSDREQSTSGSGSHRVVEAHVRQEEFLEESSGDADDSDHKHDVQNTGARSANVDILRRRT